MPLVGWWAAGSEYPPGPLRIWEEVMVLVKARAVTLGRQVLGPESWVTSLSLCRPQRKRVEV